MCWYEMNFIYAFNNQQTKISLNKTLLMVESIADNSNEWSFFLVLNLVILLIYCL